MDRSTCGSSAEPPKGAAMSDRTYQRASNPFFSQAETPSAIVDLAGSEHLTIYCGAGVTIDRTGLGWGDLIFELLRQVFNSADPELTEDDAVLLRNALSPLDLSSIYEGYIERLNLLNPHVPALQQVLYRGRVWESGVLVQNVARLAAGLTDLHRRVSIVTSNYDTYIEDALDRHLDQLQGQAGVSVPGYTVRAVGDDAIVRVRPARNSGGNIEITYLHGRVHPTDVRRGDLAISETDYHRVRAQVVKTLLGEFSGRSVLVLGASLTDPPLLEALLETRPSLTETNDAQPARYALMPATSTRLTTNADEFPRLGKHLKQRMRRYEVDLLLPDFNSQIAQFCQEVLTCAKMGLQFAEYARETPRSSHRYGERLSSWWDRWYKARAAGDDAVFHEELVRCLESLRELNGWKLESHEVYKIELWVRHNPRGGRRLALWSGSMGILSDRRIMKFADIKLDTANASVRSFVEGKPVWLNRDDIKTAVTRQAQERMDQKAQRAVGPLPRCSHPPGLPAGATHARRRSHHPCSDDQRKSYRG
ncbi:SIR2 family protein [Nocardia mangyaensis]|uniref:SIR2 family protein n=1 Tax=Nocardia mangyaensis TaxID=2213200 RepID=UPI0026750D0F|nr:SIR2 family protein [Nocardia mangyaensis]MDO3645685.1 SIR2 family protein [Nocardia mangyaensis]